MKKKNEVIEMLNNGGRILVDSISRRAQVCDASGENWDSMRYDVAERLQHEAGYKVVKTDWFASWYIEKEAQEATAAEAAEKEIAEFTEFVNLLDSEDSAIVPFDVVREIWANASSIKRAISNVHDYAETIRAEWAAESERVEAATLAALAPVIAPQGENASNQMTAFLCGRVSNETQPEVERRYLTSWDYNAALIFEELETIVKNHGGQLCRTWDYGEPPAWQLERKQYLITNRTLSRIIHEKTELLIRLEERGRTEAAQAVRDELEQYARIDNEPRLSYYGDYRYITFALDGYYYYYQVDRNPLFEFYFTKAHILTGDQINRNRYMSEDKKEWWNDCFLSHSCAPEDRREAANLIFNMLVTADESTTYHDKSRRPLTNVFYIKGDK